MKVLALCSYPTEAAATRYRLDQFRKPLSERGINLAVHPLLNSQLFESLYRHEALPRTAFGLIKSALLRVRDLVSATGADVVMVQREAMMFGPPMIEWLITTVLRRPMVLDLDDATYVSYTSPTYGIIGKSLKWFSKTDDLIRWATIVICGNRSIADYVSSKGARACLIPTVVDTDVFRPASRSVNGDGPVPHSSGPPVLGWIGTHSTFPYLKSIFPALTELAKEHDFKLKIVGARVAEIAISGIEVENLPWSLTREVQDFQSLDVGLYPIDINLHDSKWAAGKSGFKAIQYMAVGVPYVATPIGASAEIGEVGVTHFFASTQEQWRDALMELIMNGDKRKEMGAAARRHVVEHFGLKTQVDKLATALRQAASAM
jgi:glycosyltransferase involved in cell wall biosynthesis